MKKQTATTKEMLPNLEAIDLAYRLRDIVMNGNTSLEQAIYQTATPTSINALEELIGTATHLREIASLSPEEVKTRQYVKSSIQSFYGNKNKGSDREHGSGDDGRHGCGAHSTVT